MTDAGQGALARFAFEAEVIHWRGPSPFFFAPMPERHAEKVRQVARAATYGWGVIPVEAEIAGVTFTTSLIPKDETYLLPLKDAVRHTANITAGDPVSVVLTISQRQR